MRRSTIFLIYMAFNMAAVILMFAHASLFRESGLQTVKADTALVDKLRLTDLCLFTEAGYTRHLSQADFHTAFQDAPMTLEHFPSGSLAGPPQSLRKFR